MAAQIRKQSIIVHSSLRQKILFILLMLVMFGIAGICLWISENGVYVPPEFETNAINGTPQPDEHFMYGTLETDYGFTFSIATNLYQQEDGSVYVYFTNYDDNNANMMCEIINEDNGKTYYKSGVIVPGQYIEKLSPATKFPNEAFKAKVMIYSFEEGTWYSAGTVEISAMVQGW